MSQVTAAVERIPLIADSQGVLRIVGTEITLNQVVELYRAGITAEDIARRCRPVPLADIYAVLTFYLRHQEEIDAEISRRRLCEPLDVPKAPLTREPPPGRFTPAEDGPPVFTWWSAAGGPRPPLDPDEAARERSDLLARKHRGQQLSTSEQERLESLTARLRAQLSPCSIRDLESLLEMTEEVTQIRERRQRHG